jgi:hypothetical protein
MAIGRISGPLLAANLFRDNIDIAFYNVNSLTEEPILYLDVVDTRVGIRKDTPLYPLDVKGTINGDVLRIVETTPGTGNGTIGRIFISTNTISSVVGPVNIKPIGGDDINLQSNVRVEGSLHATGNITADGDIGLGNSPTDKLQINGRVDSDIIPAVDNKYNLGSSTATWEAAYLQELITSKISSSVGGIEISPVSGLLEINGQIKVNSPNKPLGTAPVVTNILYVTMDGSDTNDGSAMDASRACRTIKGATLSPLYTPGTSIRVAPGRYFENNPILMQPSTSILGSDLRTTFVEPINKTQDLFHVQSGCYIAQLQMSNGRSGLLPIDNASGYNRGAYATAFPPQVGGEKIDVFHSPYIQNCTNQSGPWLKDGVMFTPNQTVQIPKGVALGSWSANTSTLVLTLTTGTINIGDSINEGQQNSQFFDARTLILANKSHIQEQTINWINYQIATATTGSIWNGFSYARAKCFRDVGIILENLSYDTTFGGNEKTVESGKSYYNGVISVIAGQEAQTIAAINYINTLTQRVITNTTGTLFGAVTNPQVINRNLNGSIAGAGFSRNISVVTDIIARGPEIAPQTFKSAGPDYQTISAEVLLQANRRFIQNEVTAFTDYTFSGINYDVDKCKRDLNLIVDSIGFDILYPTATLSQSTFAGLQYWDQGGYTGTIANELFTTTNAIKFVSSLAQEIVQVGTTGVRYQSTVTQNVSLTSASEVEANYIKNEFALIVDIIIGGTVGVTDRIIPNNGVPTTVTSTVNAYNLLTANKNYIIAEAVAWVEQNKSTGFTYDIAKCGRDVGFMVDSVAFDLLHGGNKQAVQSGVYYYSFNGSSSAIAGTIPQTVYAYNTLTSIVSNLVQGISITPIQNKVAPVTTLPAASSTEAGLLTNALSTILSIINTGPSVVTSKEPISLTRSVSTNIERAFAILQANKEFIREEVVARTNNEFFRTNYYNRSKCNRDAGLIVDSIVQDLLFPTAGDSQSTFAGLQYWNQTTTVIPGQVTTTTNALQYAKSLARKLVINDTTNPRYSTGTQITTLPSASITQADLVTEKFDAMLDIIINGVSGITDKIVPNSIKPSFNIDTQQAFNILQANRAYMQQEVVSWVDFNKTAGWTYDRVKCERDTGFILDSISFDLLYGGNKQAIQSGAYYYGFNAGSSAIYGQTTATIAAYNRIYSIIPNIVRGIPVAAYQDAEKQVFGAGSTLSTSTIATAVNKINVITNIIQNGPTVANAPSPIAVTASTSSDVIFASQAIHANREFIQAETVAYVNQFFAFEYDRQKCSRDAGLIVDAVTQDLILHGTTKAVEAGISYWLGTKSYIQGQIPQTVAAVNRAKAIALDIIQNIPVTPTIGNGTSQIINTFFDGGYFASQSVARSFDIITNIMQNGPSVAPPSYYGVGLFASTGISNNDTKIAPKVTSVISSGTTYTIGIDNPTIGAINNGTLYFGKTAVFPKLDEEFTAQELNDWGQRTIDPNGSMGGSLVDGAVVSERSPINSFVYDAFTQVNQGGRGIHIINNGYAQLVSVFTIFCSTAVEVTDGGIASITNSNANFGDFCLVAKGKGRLDFQGTIYNPAYPTFAQSGSQTQNGQFYPNGYWPQNAEVMAFIPDTDERPHIGQVMEVVPPETILIDTTGFGNFVETPYTNDQGLPGFLLAVPVMPTLTTGTVRITGIVTDGIAIGHTVWVRDQFGSFTDANGVRYAATGTVVTDVGFESVTISTALTSGGGEVDNPSFFTLLFTGNAYYNVLSSRIAPPPVTVGNSAIPGQLGAELDALTFMTTLVLNVVANNTVIPQSGQLTEIQDRSNLSGAAANGFIADRFNDIVTIVASGVASAPASRKTGTPPPQASQAIQQLRVNKDFIIAEVTQRVINAGIYVMNPTQTYKCKRDTGIIIERLILDLTSGGNYNSIMSGLSYWSRAGTHHIISLEDQVRNPLLFPEGATISFYQRSYMSALGYTFEYVGAGTNYGSLPQVGRKDPAQNREVIQIDNGKVFFTSTDQNGDFRIGPGLVISQATGVLSGRTFTKSLFAQMTPFILAVEAGAEG